jgi:hypothetical protein
MSRQSQIMNLLHQATEEERAFVESLSDAERAEIGTENHWSAHDVLAHIAEWKERQARRIELSERGENLPSTNDIDNANRMIFEAHQQESWEDVMILLEHANQHLARAVQSLPEEALDETDRYVWQNGVPLWRRIAGNGISHTIIHLSAYEQEHGQPEKADRRQESAARWLGNLDPDPQWQGIVTYNLACHHALGGRSEKAVKGLKKALALNPSLLEWSKEDPDFASIRQDPGYQAIYQTD